MPDHAALPTTATASSRGYTPRHAALATARRRARPTRVGRLVVTVMTVLAAITGSLLAAGSANAFVNPGPHMPIGVLDSITHSAGPRNTFVHMTGWAADPDDRSAPASVLSIVDSTIVGQTTTSGRLPVRGRAFGLGPTPGFDITVAVPRDGHAHVVCAGVGNVGPGRITILGCTPSPWQPTTDTLESAQSPQGRVTGLGKTSDSLQLSGWTVDPDVRFTRSDVVLYLDGVATQTVSTGRSSFAERAAGAGPRGHFSFDVPVSAGAHIACVTSVNIALGHDTSLGCRPFDTTSAVRGPAPAIPAANRRAVREALSHIGGSYVWGAEGPRVFDCSGLVMYSYAKAGMTTPRVAADQFHAAQLIVASRAVRGDLVFYHDDNGAVYHVGIYLSPGRSVAAIDTAEGINYQTIWTDSDATYGSFTHD